MMNAPPTVLLAVVEPILLGCVVLGAIVLLPVIWVIVNYNRFQAVKQHLRESWADVDVELKRRHGALRVDVVEVAPALGFALRPELDLVQLHIEVGFARDADEFLHAFEQLVPFAAHV